MKTPMPPPPTGPLLSALAADQHRLITVLTSGRPTSDSGYLPWDQMRHRQPPNELTTEEWWLAVRMARDMMQRPLPLEDVSGKPFTYALPDDALRLIDDISRRASGEIAAPEQVTNPATRDRYVVSSLIEEAITSSQLEGASTSRRDAKAMIRSGRAPRDRSEKMILNNYLAMRHVSDIRHESITPARVCELHRVVTDGTLDNPEAAGRLQSNPDPADRVAIYGDGDVLLHRPPPVDQLPGRLEQLCSFANAASDTGPWLPPVARAVIIHFMVGYDHYFEDGNGRTARALFYWSMLKQGFWLTEYLAISRVLKNAPSKYARSYLDSEQDSGDLTYFLLYQLQVVHRALDDLGVYLSRKVAELRETRLLLSAMPGEYNRRQLAVLELALKDSQAQFTAMSHGGSHQVSTETARQDLADLESRGLLTRRKAGRQYVWAPAADLSSLLRT